MTKQGATRAGEGGFRDSKNEMCTNPKRNYKEIIKASQDFSEISSSHDLSFPSSFSYTSSSSSSSSSSLFFLFFLVLFLLLPLLVLRLGVDM